MSRARVQAVLIVAAVILLAAVTPAQQRSPFFATVVGPDGAPLAGAEVTCVFSSDLVTPWPADIVVATTDERGRARCELILGRLYRAWAVGPADADGARAVTAPMDLIAAGRVLELRAHDRRAPRRLQVVGAAPWREVGVGRLRWFPDAHSEVHQDLAWLDGDMVELPPSPDTPGCLGLLDQNGQLVTTASVASTASDPIGFAAPMLVEVVVTDTDGAPLAGTVIEHSVHRAGQVRRSQHILASPTNAPRVCGTTSAEGRLSFHAATPAGSEFRGTTHRSPLVLFAHKHGFEMQPAAAQAAGLVEFSLREQVPIELKVKSRNEPVLQLAAQGNYTLRPNPSSMMIGQRTLAARRDGPDKWSVPAQSFLPRIALDSRTPTAVVASYQQDLDAAVTIDLDELAAVDVRVLDGEGGPAPCAIAVSMVTEGHAVYWLATLATDLAGQANLRLPRTGGYFVYATTGTAHCLALIDVTEQQPVALQLKQIPTMRVEVVDAAGKPVAFARIRGNGSSYRSPSNDVLGQQWDRLASELWWSYAQARSDADGIMVVPAFIRDGLSATIIIEQGDLSSEPFGLVPGGERTVTLNR